MRSEEDKYDALIRILRKSGPEPVDAKEIGDKVIERIEKIKKKETRSINLFDYLFGWVYNEWLRRGLVAASIFIVILFAWQQSVILKRLNTLGSQIINAGEMAVRDVPDDLSGKLLLYKLSGRKISWKKIQVSEKQLEDLIESVNEVQTKYENLIQLIEDDPELRKELEKKLTEKNRKKFNL